MAEDSDSGVALRLPETGQASDFVEYGKGDVASVGKNHWSYDADWCLGAVQGQTLSRISPAPWVHGDELEHQEIDDFCVNLIVAFAGLEQHAGRSVRSFEAEWVRSSLTWLRLTISDAVGKQELVFHHVNDSSLLARLGSFHLRILELPHLGGGLVAVELEHNLGRRELLELLDVHTSC